MQGLEHVFIFVFNQGEHICVFWLCGNSPYLILNPLILDRGGVNVKISAKNRNIFLAVFAAVDVRFYEISCFDELAVSAYVALNPQIQLVIQVACLRVHRVQVKIVAPYFLKVNFGI